MPVKKRKPQLSQVKKSSIQFLSFYQERKIRQLAEIYREEAAIINPNYSQQFLAEMIDDSIINNRNKSEPDEWGHYILMDFDKRISLIKEALPQ